MVAIRDTVAGCTGMMTMCTGVAAVRDTVSGVACGEYNDLIHWCGDSVYCGGNDQRQCNQTTPVW